MIRHSIGILTTALALAAPLTCAAATAAFDRNENGIPDINFTVEIAGHGVIAFDNDEDGKYDFGFMGIVIGNQGDILEIRSLWIDKNGDGEVQKNEVRKLPGTLPYATFPTSYAHTSASNSDGSVTHFMDYTYDEGLIAHEVGHDLDGDGDIERDVFRAVGDGGTAERLALVDRDDNGFFDIFVEFMRDGSTKGTVLPKLLQKQLPVLEGMLP